MAGFISIQAEPCRLTIEAPLLSTTGRILTVCQSPPGVTHSPCTILLGALPDRRREEDALNHWFHNPACNKPHGCHTTLIRALGRGPDRRSGLCSLDGHPSVVADALLHDCRMNVRCTPWRMDAALPLPKRDMGRCDSVKELLTGAPKAVRMTPLCSRGTIPIPPQVPWWGLLDDNRSRTPALDSALWRASPNW
jgi:hypothetical protein